MHSLRVSVGTVVILLAVASAQDQPLLSTIARIPELSTFSKVVNGSGGKKLNPALEERFNTAVDGRKYTAFAPTNDAFAKIPQSIVGALTAAPAYPILESIIRLHIAEGLVLSSNITSPIVAIEGFQLVPATGPNNAVILNKQAQIVGSETTASNGVVHEVDQVLNPYTGYFGISNSTSAPAQSSDAGGNPTIAEILLGDSRLSTIRDVLNVLQPDLIQNRLRFSPSQGKQIFAAPSNAAFAAAPPGTAEASRSPSNQPLSSLLFSFGMLYNSNPNSKLADLNLGAGNATLANVFTGLNVTVSQRSGGAVYVNNAAVEGEICGSNGCIWVVDRILDPLYLTFGPLDRA